MTTSGSVSLMFKAFADETRLRILHLLSLRETCVGDLVEVLQVPQPTASRHLSYLRKAGLVESRKEGLWVYYSLAAAHGSFHERLLDCVRCCFGEVLELAADSSRSRELEQGGGCCPSVAVSTAGSTHTKGSE